MSALRSRVGAVRGRHARRAAPQSAAAKKGTFFTETRKGEMNELRKLLGDVRVQRDTKRMREVVKKVISYMTQGIDVSRLFDTMITLTYTKDIVLKKMVYQYVCYWAELYPELAVLAINTLQKETKDSDPMVRGLALRCLCSLNVTDILEYVAVPVQNGLRDPLPYVRKTAVMCVLRLYHLDPERFGREMYVHALYDLVKGDSDPTVICNCVSALNDILRDEGGMALNKAIVAHLLNKMGQFSEWGQCTVLDLITAKRYVPSGDDEIFAIMNVVDAHCLKKSKSSVVLCAASLMLYVSTRLSDPAICAQVYQRLKTPLLTLVATGTPESKYAVLCHIALIAESKHGEGVFDHSFKQFFVRYNEPSYVKHIKVHILPLLTSETIGNYGDILADGRRWAARPIARMARRLNSGSRSETYSFSSAPSPKKE